MPVPLAGGENIVGDDGFAAATALGALRFIQPDIAKWGGLSGGLRVAARARRAGRTMCPHFLGGGVGLIASAHFLSAAGGDGLLELDANPNPLRDAFLATRLIGSQFQLCGQPGYGIEELPAEILPYRTLVREAS